MKYKHNSLQKVTLSVVEVCIINLLLHVNPHFDYTQCDRLTI